MGVYDEAVRLLTGAVAQRTAITPLTDTIGGQVPIISTSLGTALPHARSGKLRLLAVTSAQRSPMAPELPTLAESGAPGYEASTWTGILAPSATPKNVIERLNAVIVRGMQTPANRERMMEMGADPITSTPERFGAFMQDEADRLAVLVKRGALKIEP